MASYSREQVIILAAIVPVVLASIVAAGRYRSVGRAGRLLAGLVWFALATEIVSRVLWFYKINNLILWPVYTSVEFGLLLCIFSLHWRGRLTWREGLVIAVFAAGAAVEAAWRFRQPLIIDNLARAAESLALVVLALGYFYSAFREAESGATWRQPMLWVSMGVLLFFSANFIIYLFINFALNYSQMLNYQIWATHAVVNSLLYAAYAYALWISPRK